MDPSPSNNRLEVLMNDIYSLSWLAQKDLRMKLFYLTFILLLLSIFDKMQYNFLFILILTHSNWTKLKNNKANKQ